MGKALGNAVLSGQPEEEIFRRCKWIKFYTRIPPSSTADRIPVVLSWPNISWVVWKRKCTSLRLEDWNDRCVPMSESVCVG